MLFPSSKGPWTESYGPRIHAIRTFVLWPALGRQQIGPPRNSDSPRVWHERHLPAQGSLWQPNLMSLNEKFNLCCTAACGLRGVVAVVLGVAGAAPGAAAESALSYPYLDGSERAFPAYRAAAERAARGYVMVTLLARPDPISREGGGELHTGSGIVLSRDGFILTAAHIARGPEFDVRVRLADGRTLPAQVVKISAKQELAILKTAPLPDAEPLAFADSHGVKQGDPALALGSPRRVFGVVSVGRVRAPNIGERLEYGNWGFDNAIEIAMEV